MDNKFAIITDLHFGVNGNSDMMLDSQERYFKEEFVPYIKENKLDFLVIAGDLFENQNSINVKVLNKAVEIIEEIASVVSTYVLVGNHDIYYKSNLAVNSLKIIKGINRVTVVDKPVIINAGAAKLALVPWITGEPEFPEADYCIGHFDVVGAMMRAGRPSEKGMVPSELLSRYKATYSGHYHCHSKIESGGNKIEYVGCPYQLTRNDKGEEKGFLVVELDCGSISEEKYVYSKNSIKFVEAVYPNIPDESCVKGNVVDIIVEYGPNFNEFEFNKYLSVINSMSPASNPSIKASGGIVITSSDGKAFDVHAVMHKYIDETNISEDKKSELIKLFDELYTKNMEL